VSRSAITATRKKKVNVAEAPREYRSFVECLYTVPAFQEHFAGPSYDSWRALSKAVFPDPRYPMTPAELELFRECTGRVLEPTTQATELWMRGGRRSGKDWWDAAVAVYLALVKKYKLKPGVVGRGVLLAVNQKQAQECYGYISQLIDANADWASQVVSRKSSTYEHVIKFTNGIQIEILATDKRSIRGRSFIFVLGSEGAWWWNEDHHQNPASEIIKAVRPAFAKIPSPLLVMSSSPHRPIGIMYDTEQANFGKDFLTIETTINGEKVQRDIANPTLFWGASTEKMWTPLDGSPFDPEMRLFLDIERAKDPQTYRVEYGAQYDSESSDFLPREVIEACIVAGRGGMPYTPGLRFVAAIDTAGGTGSASAALAIMVQVTLPNGRFGIALAALFEKRPPFDSSKMVQEFAGIVKSYGLTKIYGDGYSGDVFPSLFRAQGITYETDGDSATKLYQAIIPRFTGRQIQLLDPKTSDAVKRMVDQFVTLERKRGGERIDAPSGAQDDLSNAVALAAKHAFKPPQGVVVASVTITPHGPVVNEGKVILPGEAPKTFEKYDAENANMTETQRNAWKTGEVKPKDSKFKVDKKTGLGRFHTQDESYYDPRFD